MYTVGSLFSGIGGIDLGFEKAGFRIVWQVEKNVYCRKLLRKSFPDASRRVTDVRFAGARNLFPVDIIAGGDPCQENSNARRAHETVSPSLGNQFIRIVDELRPRIVLRENPSAIRSDAPWPWFRFRDALERLGYAVLPFRLRACCAGGDHERERLFLLAELQNANIPRLEGYERKELARQIQRGCDANSTRPDRRHSPPRICGKSDGIPYRMDRLKGIGNAVAPDVAEFIAQRVKKCLER